MARALVPVLALVQEALMVPGLVLAPRAGLVQGLTLEPAKRWQGG